MRSGYVSIVGRPNVGKSTLLNSILETKLAITSNKAGTTRNIIQGVYEDGDSQIVFVDTPGIHKPINKLGNILNKKAYSTSENVDLILFLVDVEAGIGKGDMFILDRLKEEKLPIILVLNKVDRIAKDKLLEIIMKYKDLYDFSEIFPISALKNDNVDALIKTIKNYLPNEGKIFEDETFTNISTNFYISEIIREKVLRKTREEVPHSVTCIVEKKIEENDKVIIQATIIVDRDSIKKIIVGKNASMLKDIGIDARCDLEEYFGKKVYLELFVKTIKNWRDREKYLKELGLDELEG
ncbi:MAG: GTPase Era [Tenericutes bacterium]|nr:GTPase Era [Mycoplasmatota bacterium]